MLLLDTSGSMEHVPGCECVTPTCKECWPDCTAGEQNTWAHVVAALGGSFAPFACEAKARTQDDGASYDVGYPIPRHAIVDQSVQREDGSVPGVFNYPQGDDLEYRMDTGIRSAEATDGALVFARDAEDAVPTAMRIGAALRTVRTFGGTPTAAAFDDLAYFFRDDREGPGPRRTDETRYVVLITDGPPDTDYRDIGCDCAQTGSCPSGLDASRFKCPYPMPSDAVSALRCGAAGSACGDAQAAAVDGVHVIAFGVTAQGDKDSLDALARAGGTDSASMVNDGEELRAALTEILRGVTGTTATD